MSNIESKYEKDEKDKKLEKDEWMKNFSNMLNRLLGEKGVSINKAAVDIGIDAKTLRLYVNKKTVPTAINLKKLAKAFNVSTDYLVSGGTCERGYSDKTILELAYIIKNFDVSLEKISHTGDEVTLKINDKNLSMVIKELFLTKKAGNYDAIAEKLAKAYGNMKVYNNHLMDYTSFENMIRHEYIYGSLEEQPSIMKDDNGDDCYCFYLDETFDEIDKRADEWEKMSCVQKEQWWKQYSKEKEVNP